MARRTNFKMRTVDRGEGRSVRVRPEDEQDYKARMKARDGDDDTRLPIGVKRRESRATRNKAAQTQGSQSS